MPYGVDDFKIRTGLPQLPDDNIPPELYGSFLYVYQAIQNLQRGVSEYCGVDAPDVASRPILTPFDTLLSSNLTRMYPVASVAILRGQIVNLFDNAGSLGARLADASSATTMAHGIANEDAAPGAQFEMYLGTALVSSIGSLTIGTTYYLSTAAGSVQNLRPTVPGEIVQPVGLALGPSTFAMNIPLYFEQL